MPGVFAQYPVASWQVGTASPIRFPIVGPLKEKGGKRVVQHTRPYRKGSKLDDTGASAREFSFTARFNNTIKESGLEDNPRQLYPFMLRDLVASFDTTVTGTLILPTVGAIRAKPSTWERSEDIAEQDEATLTVTFIEDNEESLATSTFSLPSVRATVIQQAGQTTFSAAREGALDSDLISLQQFAIEIESMLLAPGRSVADLQTKATASRRAIQRIFNAQVQFAEDVGGSAIEPRGSEFWRNLMRLSDTQARAADEKFASRPRVKTFVVDVAQTSLFEIAARLKQDAGELLDLNSERVPDPFFLERGDVIRVFERAA